MYEHYLTATHTGVTDIDIEFDDTDSNSNIDNTDPSTGILLTVTFAVTTDSEAWMTIGSDGFVYPSFGGTGTTQPELDSYAEHTVAIWRAITNDHSTTCRYKLPTDDDRDQSADEHVIDA